MVALPLRLWESWGRATGDRVGVYFLGNLLASETAAKHINIDPVPEAKPSKSKQSGKKEQAHKATPH